MYSILPMKCALHTIWYALHPIQPSMYLTPTHTYYTPYSDHGMQNSIHVYIHSPYICMHIQFTSANAHACIGMSLFMSPLHLFIQYHC